MKLIQNAVYCTDTDLYHISRHVHDFVEFDSGGKKGLFIDGGLEYVRATVMPHTVLDWCLYEESPQEEIKEKLLWGTFGINGDQPLRWVPLSKCTSDHLKNILKNVPGINHKTQSTIREILSDRGEKE